MSKFKLDIASRYIPGADAIVGIIYVKDVERNVWVYTRLGTTEARLVDNGSGEVLVRVAIDRRMGSSDGAIRVIFNHPVQTMNLSFEVVTDILDASEPTHLERIVPVELDVANNPGNGIPLGEQPEVHLEMRARARLNEVLVDG